MKNYYQILGLDSKATSMEIKKAYRRLALIYHPDKNSGDKDSERKFIEVNEAYSMLSDELEKSKYDLLHNNTNSKTQAPDEDKSPIQDEFYELKLGLNYVFINGERVTYNKETVLIKDIVAFKFGMKIKEYLPDSYTVSVIDKNKKELNIECHPLMVSDARAQKVFVFLVTAMTRWVVPIIFRRLIDQIENGLVVHIADIDIDKNGIKLLKKSLFTANQVYTLKWNEFNAGFHMDSVGEYLRVTIPTNKIIFEKKWADIWNASFLEKIRKYYES